MVILLQYPGTCQIHKTFRCQWLLANSEVLPRASGRVADSSGFEYTELQKDDSQDTSHKLYPHLV